MNEKQLERLHTLVDLKAQMAKWGGAKPFDRITGFIDQALDALVEEIEGRPKEQPKTVITPKGQEKPNTEKTAQELENERQQRINQVRKQNEEEELRR